jgi:hypothetical protein
MSTSGQVIRSMSTLPTTTIDPKVALEDGRNAASFDELERFSPKLLRALLQGYCPCCCSSHFSSHLMV